MKRYHVIAVALLLSCAAAAWGAEPDTARMQPIAYRLDVVQLTDAGAAQIAEQVRLPAGFLAHAVKSGHARLVQTAELLTVTGRDAQFLLGRKTPLAFYDTRSSQFQIQYVDIGFKLVALGRDDGDKGFSVEAFVETTVFEALRTPGGPNASAYPLTAGLVARTRLAGARLGDAFIAARGNGAEARKILTGLGLTSPGDHIVMILTLLRP